MVIGGILCTVAAFSQNYNRSVVASAGESSSSANYTFDWTLGEIAGETVSNHTSLFTQGFNQPFLSVKSLTASSPEEITVMPNPVQSDLNIFFKTLRSGKVMITLVNEEGRQVIAQQANIVNGLITIHLSGFARGAYFLAVKNEHAAVIGSFKVIRN